MSSGGAAVEKVLTLAGVPSPKRVNNHSMSHHVYSRMDLFHGHGRDTKGQQQPL